MLCRSLFFDDEYTQQLVTKIKLDLTSFQQFKQCTMSLQRCGLFILQHWQFLSNSQMHLHCFMSGSVKYENVLLEVISNLIETFFE